MSFQSFFDYPTTQQDEVAESLVFLPQWDEAQWQTLLRYTEKILFHSGQTLMEQGGTDRTMYILIRGDAEVTVPGKRGKPVQIGVRNAGTIIGEQSFLEGRPRSASIRALTDGEMLSISHTAFETFRVREPKLAYDFLSDLARLLSAKLRQSTKIITRLTR